MVRIGIFRSRCLPQTFILLCLLTSCGDNKPHSRNLDIKSPHMGEASDSLEMAKYARKSDSLGKIQREAIGEPEIDTYKQEVFRYSYWESFGPTRILRVERRPDSSYVLASAFILDGVPARYTRLPKIPYRVLPDYFKQHGDSLVVFTSTQSINKEEWLAFRQIIDGSYYWTFKDPMAHDMILDGDGLVLQSKSYWPRHYEHGDTLPYHYNSVHCPLKGSYTNAYDYLAKRSRLFQKLKYPAVIWH